MAARRQKRPAALAMMVALGLASGCPEGEIFRPLDYSIQAPTPPKQERVVPEQVSPYPKIDPATVTPLEIVVVGEPVGKGYPRVPVRMSKPLFSDKWLGLANGDMEFMGPRHIIVNRFRSRPDHLGEGDLLGNVLLNVETGEVVAEFRYGRYVQWERGLAIVYKHGEDDRPYLLDAATGTFVLAVPEGDHQYENGENYHLRFSANGPHIWITAIDRDDTVHLYAWDKLDVPPELPNNPFPFEPKNWDPLDSDDNDGDTEEVLVDFYAQGKGGCTRALLSPPKGWVCLDAEGLEDSKPLSEGWRIEGDNVFNRDDGRGFDLSSLCPEGDRTFVSIRHRSPPQLEVSCEVDLSVWLFWTAPDRLRKIDSRYSAKNEWSTIYDSERDRLRARAYKSSDALTHFDSESGINKIIGTEYACANLDYATGTLEASAVICENRYGAPLWAELQDDVRGIRSQHFKATVVVASDLGVVVGVVRRSDRDHVVRISLATR
jgi:hypothetical protein